MTTSGHDAHTAGKEGTGSVSARRARSSRNARLTASKQTEQEDGVDVGSESAADLEERIQRERDQQRRFPTILFRQRTKRQRTHNIAGDEQLSWRRKGEYQQPSDRAGRDARELNAA